MKDQSAVTAKKKAVLATDGQADVNTDEEDIDNSNRLFLIGVVCPNVCGGCGCLQLIL